MSGATFDAQLVVTAPAKINLFFELLARQPDGFHDVETIMTTVSLCDTLAFRSTRGTDAIRFRTRWSHGLSARSQLSTIFGDLPQDGSNLVVRALKLLQSTSDSNSGADVQLIKRIPSGGGLGGGSSDAAAALIAGNLGWRLGLSTQHLMELGSQLGSDIPFFVATWEQTNRTTAAVCTGRGERIERIPPLPRAELILVRPPESLGTADVYRQSTVPKKHVRLSEEFRKGTIRSPLDFANRVFNRLEEPARVMTQWIERIDHAFSKLPFIAHQMSGSGSTYFGICQNRADAQRAQHQLRAADIGLVMRATTGATMNVYHTSPSTN